MIYLIYLAYLIYLVYLIDCLCFQHGQRRDTRGQQLAGASEGGNEEN